MTIGICSLCATGGRTEIHHVARQRYAGDLTVRVCRRCHDHLTGMHLAAGIQDGNWRRDAATERDAASAAILGVLHVLTLLANYAGEHGRRDGLSAAEPAIALALRCLVGSSAAADGRPDAPIGSPRWCLLPDYPDRTGRGELPDAALADLLTMVRELGRILSVDVAIPDDAENLSSLPGDLLAGDAFLSRFSELFAPHRPEPSSGEVERLALNAAEWIASVRTKPAE